MTTENDRLALDGGPPAVQGPLPPVYPGGMRISQEERDAVLAVLERKRLFRYYGPGPAPSQVAEFETEFASTMGAGHALAVGSGTTALAGALAALGVGPGDEVVVPAYTWIATAAAVTSVGAVPVVAEVDESLTLDPVDFEARVTDRTRAAIVVHMRGAPADMDPVLAVARRHGLAVLEDVAQACGAQYHGRRCGAIGDLGAFSLQFNKILTSGEGGVITTDDPRLHHRAAMYHDVAASQRAELSTEDTFVGITCRMSELQGAVALAQLKRLDGILGDARERKWAIKDGIGDLARSKNVEFRRLNDEKGDTGIALVFYLPTSEEARHVAEALRAEGTGAHTMFSPSRPDYHIAYHWTPILHQRSWSRRSPWQLHSTPVEYSPHMWPRTLDLLGRAVHLDISPDLTEDQVRQLTHACRKVLGSL